MKEDKGKLNIAIVGGGLRCKAILKMFEAEHILTANIVGVADINENAIGFKYAQKKGIFTTKNYGDFYKFRDLNLIIELTNDDKVPEQIIKTKPTHVRLMDHNIARLFWDVMVYTRGLIESNPDLLVTFDKDGIITDLNEATIKATGYKLEELIGTPFKNYFTDPERAEQGAMIAVKRGKVANYELVMKCKSGEEIPVSYNAIAVRDAEGNIRGVLATARDIRHVWEKLARSEKLAVLGRLSGGLAHELRQPLGVMNNAIYFLNMTMTDANEVTREYLKILETEIQNAERIVKNLLDFIRTRPPEREEVVVEQIIEGILDTCRIPKGINISLQFQAGKPLAFVDPNQMRQALFNLIHNAIQAMPKGGELTIRTGNRANSITIDIIDSGYGISSEDLEKIFEPLYTTKARGIGMGLSVTKGLVEANGGTIKVKSEINKGSTFTVNLPTKK
ncbi:MAG TPA: PAS domain S-box protein [Syntrophaceae bacterium]|nr:PAS domain S-box protein [Syntrophaceae bacterium]